MKKKDSSFLKPALSGFLVGAVVVGGVAASLAGWWQQKLSSENLVKLQSDEVKASDAETKLEKLQAQLREATGTIELINRQLKYQKTQYGFLNKAPKQVAPDEPFSLNLGQQTTYVFTCGDTGESRGFTFPIKLKSISKDGVLTVESMNIFTSNVSTYGEMNATAPSSGSGVWDVFQMQYLGSDGTDYVFSASVNAC
jgi:hypothetical protein